MSKKALSLLISGIASNQGKTTITACLAYKLRKMGFKVQVFKIGPDFLDPQILEFASGNPVKQLDLWMVGHNNCVRLLYEAYISMDYILIEGVMGLYDGIPSTADLAIAFNIPVIAIIDASSMAQSFAALAYGLVNYNNKINLCGVLANRIASDHHLNLIHNSDFKGVKFLGGIEENSKIAINSRHLGLCQAKEIPDLISKLESGIELIDKCKLINCFEPIEFAKVKPIKSFSRSLKNKKIGIAKDLAFSFLYSQNINVLEKLGAKIVFFSVLNDKKIPDIDSLYLPGGYPELHLKALEENISMQASIIMHYQSNKKIYAECGGMLYLMESLTDTKGNSAKLTSIIPGQAVMQSKISSLGYQELATSFGNIRGHTFHYSNSKINLYPLAVAKYPNKNIDGEAIYKINSLTATYCHFYFDSNIDFVASLF